MASLNDYVKIQNAIAALAADIGAIKSALGLSNGSGGAQNPIEAKLQSLITNALTSFETRVKDIAKGTAEQVIIDGLHKKMAEIEARLGAQ